MKITDEMIEAACKATVLGEDRRGKPVHLEPREARTALEAALTIYDLNEEERRERILETVASPDNGTHEEVLAAILICARAWVPEARIIGNVRAGDIARVVSEILASAVEPVRWQAKYHDDTIWVDISKHRVDEFRASGKCKVRGLYPGSDT